MADKRISKRQGQVFNAISEFYDNVSFLRKTAERLVEHAKIVEGQCVLDIACGTGSATIRAARATGKNGSVTGIDIADKMVKVAKTKSKLAGLSNIKLLVGDAQKLENGDASFDTVICASSIFVFKDIPMVLREWCRVLKPDGKIVFSSFQDGLLDLPFKFLIGCLLKYNAQVPPSLFMGGTNTSAKCRELLQQSGFSKISVISEQLGYYVENIEDVWHELSSTIIKLALDRLNADQIETVKKDYFAKIEPLRTKKGFWLDIPAIFSVAKKPV